MSLLALIPSRLYEYALIILACGLIATGFIVHERSVGAVKVEAVRTAEHAAQAAVAASAIAKNQTETNRRIAATQEIVHATEVSASAVAADAASAVVARDAARVQLDAYVRRNAMPSHPAASVGGPAATDPDVLLAGLLNTAWDRSVELALEAGKRGVAGNACVGSYGALMP